MRVTREFEPLLDAFDLDLIDADPGVTFGLLADGRLALTNAAWDRFASDNGAPHLSEAWPLGRNLYEAIPDELQQFYREGWEWTIESGHPWSHTYECSSPAEYRRHRMTCYPVGGAGILVVNSLVAATSWPGGEVTQHPRTEYRDAAGGIRQCPHCRRTQHVQTGRWDWVPEWVQRWPEDARAALCDVCLAYHYYEGARHAPPAG